jgi:hypothetical protein
MTPDMKRILEIAHVLEGKEKASVHPRVWLMAAALLVDILVAAYWLLRAGGWL